MVGRLKVKLMEQSDRNNEPGTGVLEELGIEENPNDALVDLIAKLQHENDVLCRRERAARAKAASLAKEVELQRQLRMGEFGGKEEEEEEEDGGGQKQEQDLHELREEVKRTAQERDLLAYRHEQLALQLKALRQA